MKRLYYLNRKQISQLRTMKVLFFIYLVISLLILGVSYYGDEIADVMGIICFSLVSILFYIVEREILRDINKNSNHNGKQDYI